jgi:hypothetical protein
VTAIITRLVGVYAAEGTLRGEVAYWIGARLGRTHCSLCEITHGVFTESKEWQACKIGLPVPFDTYHRNDQPDAVRLAAGNLDPVVVAETSGGLVVLVGPAELDACGGSAEKLIVAIEAAVVRLGLSFSSQLPS